MTLGQPIGTIVLALLGLASRFVVSITFGESLRQRVEVTTPISDWKRAHEAVHLLNSGLDPYSDNLFHEYPISLQFYKIILNYFNIDITFALTDVFTAIILKYSVINQMKVDNERAVNQFATKSSNLVYLIYLFSPLTIITSAARSTSTYTNFLIALISLILFMKPFRASTCVLCAILACNNIHLSTIVIPIFLCQEFYSHRISQSESQSNEKQKLKYYERSDFYSSLSTSFIICLASILTLLLTSYLVMDNSWSFIRATYLYVLTVQDLTPNIGMFWYFFTEMFDHFLDFFTWVVQINAFIHVVPLSISLRDSPFFLLYVIILTSTIFQPYPNLAHIGLLTSLLPQHRHLFAHMNHGLKISCTLITCMCLWPVFWHLWIMTGTANSNFYFGATAAFVAALILLLSDLLNAHNYIKAKSRFEELQKEQRSESKVIHND